MLVDTDYPATDVVVVLLSRWGGDRARRTPLRVRIPGWATRATAWFNGQRVATRNGTMLDTSCAPGLSLCNLTLKLSPQVRLESWFNDSVSVLRGPLVSIGTTLLFTNLNANSVIETLFLPLHFIER